MVNNYYTLKYVSADLDSKLNGFEITEVFTQYKNELVISFSNDSESFSLQISIDPQNAFLLLRTLMVKAKANVMSLFPKLINQIVEKVSINETDRIIEIIFRDSVKLIITFFRGESNIYFIDMDNIIISTFKKGKVSIGEHLKIDKRDFNIMKYLSSSEEFQNSFRAIKEKNLIRTFNKILPILGTLITKEIIYRANFDPAIEVIDLSNIELNQVWQKFKEVYNELRNPKPQVYFDGNKPLEFSIINLKHLHKHDFVEYENVYEAIKIFLFQKSGIKKVDFRREEIIKKIDNELVFLSSSIAKLEKEITINRADEYNHYGDILMANLVNIQPGSEEFEVEENGIPVKILLDATSTPIQNATYYFEKSKKAKEAKRISEKRLEDAKRKKDILDKIFTEMKSEESSEQFNEILKKYKMDLEKFNITESEEKQKEISLFRRFIVEGGFEVLAGKNSENNDLLTMKYAKQEDLWFHARGGGGSHVVLKVNSGKGEPSKKAIAQAASIAAYYSQSKNSSMAPVAMCLKKYVRKPKGAKAGTVTISREKVIFATPALPNQ